MTKLPGRARLFGLISLAVLGVLSLVPDTIFANGNAVPTGIALQLSTIHDADFSTTVVPEYPLGLVALLAVMVFVFAVIKRRTR